jgi:ABC-type branched-subunit amino acid transport system ATPase component/signal transduction histidine kinase
MSASEPLLAGTHAPLLEVVDLTKSFGPLTVLRDVSLSIRRGEVLALVGENGAGKSSLVSCLARIFEPESGEIRLNGSPMPETPEQVREAGVEVLWQDHGLCENLDVVANVFLGRERRRWFAENGMREEATAALHRVGADGLPLDREVRTLSRGQRQLVALGRAILPDPRVLILDEPTASLGVVETLRIQALIREIRAAGAAILLVSHDLEQVFGLADRVVVLRQGRVVADVSPLEVHREDLVALMSGIEMDSVARRQLHRLRSLVDQLSDVEPGASLPLIVSAMAAALDQDMLCVHLLELSDEGERWLRRSAAVGLPAPLLRVNEHLPIGPEGACAGLAAEVAEVVVVDDLWSHPVPDGYREAAAASDVRSEWAAPIVGTRGVLGTVSGYGTLLGTPEPERLELARLYLNYAASAIERERLLSEVSRRNRVLESLRGMLETLAGPERVEGGLGVSLVALSRGLGADEVGVLVEEEGALVFRATNDDRRDTPDEVTTRLRSAAEAILSGGDDGRARLLSPDIAAVPLRLPEGRAALVAHWGADTVPGGDTLELLDDATRSLALAMEGEALENAKREAGALRRSHSIQRELMSWLSHELRTPLTAIQGYASTLRQPDLTWDAESTERFVSSIAAESARMERLVGDLLDSSAIESGILRLQGHWCDLRLVLEAAVDCMPETAGIHLTVQDRLEPIWGDHDRLEQVFVNLLENASTHGFSDQGVSATMRRGRIRGTVEVEVRDHGPGIPSDAMGRIFQPRFRGPTDVAGAGLGLSIAKGIVEAHGGVLATVPADPGASFVVSLPVDPPPDDLDGPIDASWNLVDRPKESDVV